MSNPVLFTIGDGMTPGIQFTLRDLFAMASLNALLCQPGSADPKMTRDVIALAAYMVADAMLSEREKAR
jgi:hypothetical protein